LIERVGRFTVDCAIDETRRLYAARETGASEACGCLYCRNFVDARDVVYTESQREQLTRLGVDWRKEDEAAECGLPRSGLRTYLTWFSVAGRITDEEPSAGEDDEPTVEPGRDGLVEVHFALGVPWVLDAEEPNW
jgi:hypothetical protein